MDSLSLFLILTHLVRISSDFEDPKSILRLSNLNESNDVSSYGCYMLPEGEDAAVMISKDVQMTPVWCTNDCWLQDYKLSLLTNRIYCYCGDEVGEKKTISSCNIPCPGASSQNCGGQDVATVHKTGYVKINYELMDKFYNSARVLKMKRRNQTKEEMTNFDGGRCYDWEPDSSRMLVFLTYKLSTEMCIVFCFHYKYVYAMTRRESQCACTSETPNKGGDSNGDNDNESNCNFDCPRGGGKCGGSDNWHSVWFTGHIESDDYVPKENFTRLPALEQNWTMYFRQHKDVADFLVTEGRAPVKKDSLTVLPEAEIYDTDTIPENKGEETNQAMLLVGGVATGIVVLAVVVVAINSRIESAMKKEDEKHGIKEKYKKRRHKDRSKQSPELPLTNKDIKTEHKHKSRHKHKKEHENKPEHKHKSDNKQKSEHKHKSKHKHKTEHKHETERKPKSEHKHKSDESKRQNSVINQNRHVLAELKYESEQKVQKKTKLEAVTDHINEDRPEV